MAKDNHSKRLAKRLAAIACKMNHDIRYMHKDIYKQDEQLLDFAAEIATDMGFEVHVIWRRDGQIEAVTVGNTREEVLCGE